MGDRLSLHRQLHLDTRLRFRIKDGYAHALLHTGTKHRGRSDQITPERRARLRKGSQSEIRKEGEREGGVYEKGRNRSTGEDDVEVAKQRERW